VSQASRTPDHYATLRVPRNADAARIRDAYRVLARRHHPDLHPGDRDAEETLKRINEAYEVLSDPEKRRKYDVLGAEWEEIVREDEHLRRAAGFARPNPAQPSASWDRRGAGEDVAATVLFDAVGRAPILVLTLFMIGIAMMASRVPRLSPRKAAADTGAVRVIAEAGPGIRLLHGTLAEFRAETLEQGAERRSEDCEGWERRYAVAAGDVATQIDRAEADGLFVLPLAARDRQVLGSLLTLRSVLEQQAGGGMVGCTDDELPELARLVGTVERCLYRLSMVDARTIRAQARAGRGTCR
jgi:curved DNA-binding protein CbpA